MSNSVLIDCPVEDLFDYITRPWLWHEWHPNSVQASEHDAALKAGDSFDEVIELRPGAIFPVTIRRETSYSVVCCQTPNKWKVEGRGRDFTLTIEYVCERDGDGSKLTRTLTFDVGGKLRFLTPLIRRVSVKNSHKALQKLKKRLENDV